MGVRSGERDVERGGGKARGRKVGGRSEERSARVRQKSPAAAKRAVDKSTMRKVGEIGGSRAALSKAAMVK